MYCILDFILYIKLVFMENFKILIFILKQTNFTYLNLFNLDTEIILLYIKIEII